VVETSDSRQSGDLGALRGPSFHSSTVRCRADGSVDAIAVVVVDVLAGNSAEARIACRNMAVSGGGCPHPESGILERSPFLTPFPAQPPKRARPRGTTSTYALAPGIRRHRAAYSGTGGGRRHPGGTNFSALPLEFSCAPALAALGSARSYTLPLLFSSWPELGAGGPRGPSTQDFEGGNSVPSRELVPSRDLNTPSLESQS
jgi:hypothetical protein